MGGTDAIYMPVWPEKESRIEMNLRFLNDKKCASRQRVASSITHRSTTACQSDIRSS